MSPQRLRQIEDLYHAARERGEAVLADADPELRREVEKLLAQDSEGGKLLDQRPSDLMAHLADKRVAAGSLLGPYKIESALGRGGMGQVFRATDTRLGRAVAIKIANEKFSDRFERESRAIAALNHPNICTLHDVGPDYLVMELVEGETLAGRLQRGKLSVAQTVRFGAQIAEALSAAHAKGIIHRDLKPANIMLTKSGVKVLDFGLAKSSVDPALTPASVAIGTPAYMAPEQFEGKEADARTDIYALGLLLSEMATGKRSEKPEGLPPALDRLVARCLEPDPDERWQSARDLKWELESSAIAPVATPLRSWNTRLAVALGFVALLLAVLVFLRFREQPPAPQAARMSVLLPEKSRPLSLAVSPNGREIAVVLVKDGKQQIWVRALDALKPVALAGTEGAADPFWSPDSRSIAFFADAKLKKIDHSGGPVQTLCDALGVLGGTWNRNGDILLGGLTSIQRVSDAGGIVTDLPKQTAARETWPVFLPDGRHYLATIYADAGSKQGGIWLSSMDEPEAHRILPDVSKAEVTERLPGGHVGAVLFTRAGTLMALPFEFKRLEPAGDSFPIAEDIARITGSPEYYWLASASNQGVLAYVSGHGAEWQYAWHDRKGEYLGTAGEAGGVAMISPDGRRLAGDRGPDIWLLEFPRGVATRLTFAPPANNNPIWSPDGRYVAYHKDGLGIYRKPANGAGAEELLVPAKALAVPKSWSPDGRFIIYAQINPGTGADLLAIPVEPDPKPFVIAQTAANEDQGQFSPDGHWVAYTSNESGLSEIYVIPFPPSPSGGKWLVSRGGGVQPRWRRNGKELFYISPDWKMMAVEVNTKPVFQSGTPRSLFQTDMVDTGIRTGPMSWDLAPDGDRFLIISESPNEMSSLTVALNWRAAPAK